MNNSRLFQQLHYTSGSKLTISVSQALLILMDHYRNNHDFLEELKPLYLVGNNNKFHAKQLSNWLNDHVLKDYNISFEPTIINEDASRRYFETHLAYETLKKTIDKLKIKDLEKQLDVMCQIIDNRGKTMIQSIINGNFEDVIKIFDIDDFDIEYYDAYCKIFSKDPCYQSFSGIQKKKLGLILLCVYSNLFTEHINLPIDIYGKGYYSPDKRGKEAKANQSEVKAYQLGLMKSYMPISCNDIASSNRSSPYLRVADRHRFINNRDWVKLHFSQYVHPFSCSISGSMLLFLKVTKFLHGTDQYLFADIKKFKSFLKCFVSLLLVNSGGHSLFEFLYPLKLTEVKDAFSCINGFNKINIQSLFFTNNKEAFNIALQDTIRYHQIILNNKSAHTIIKVANFENNTNNSETRLELVECIRHIKNNFDLEKVEKRYIENLTTFFNNLDSIIHEIHSSDEINILKIISSIHQKLIMLSRLVDRNNKIHHSSIIEGHNEGNRYIKLFISSAIKHLESKLQVIDQAHKINRSLNKYKQ